MSVVPGLGGLLGSANAGVGNFYLHITSDESDVNVWERMGSPSGVISQPIVEVDAGVSISSSAQGIPGMDFSGFADGTKALLVMIGANVNGKGGNGGVGVVKSVPVFYGGGGGGGGGSLPGDGGLAGDAPGSANIATDGQPGGPDLGGDGGQSDSGLAEAPPPSAVGFGDDGGDAIYLGTTDLDIDAGGTSSGNIWSGGGGGAGGTDDNPQGIDGWPGGAAGNGSPSWSGAGGVYPTGAPGYAIRGTTGVVAFIGGVPDANHLRGPVGGA